MLAFSLFCNLGSCGGSLGNKGCGAGARSCSRNPGRNYLLAKKLCQERWFLAPEPGPVSGPRTPLETPLPGLGTYIGSYWRSWPKKGCFGVTSWQ